MTSLSQLISYARNFVQEPYQFMKENEKDSYILFFIFGLLCSFILIMPYHYIHKNFMRSACFGIAVIAAITFTVAFAAAFAETLTEAVDCLSGLKTKGKIASVIIAGLLSLGVSGTLATAMEFEYIKEWGAIIIAGLLSLGVSGTLATGMELQCIKEFGTIIFPVCLFVFYFFSCLFIIACRNRETQKGLLEEEELIISDQKLRLIALIWFGVTALLFNLALYTDITQSEKNKEAAIITSSLLFILLPILYIIFFYLKQLPFFISKIENPYIAGPALKRDTDLFFGRQDAFDSIEKLIKEGHRTIVCYGLKRTGKSSLLYRIETKCFSDNKLIPIYFDMQDVDDEKHFYKSLSKQIAKQMKYTNTDYPESFAGFKEWLDTVRKVLNEKILVLMIDEFEAIQQRVEDKKITNSIFSNIRSLMDKEEKLIFLFCGSHKLEEMNSDMWSCLFNFAKYYKVSYLTKKDTYNLIKNPVKGKMSYDKDTVKLIFEMTHGQPYLTQMICRDLINNLNEKKRKSATINDVNDVVDRIVSQGVEHFSEHIWEESKKLKAGHLILSSMADELIHKHLENISFDAIYDKVSAISKKFSRKDCLETANKFVSKDILSEKNMNYSFVMGLFKKWVGSRHSLAQVREEI